MTIKTELQEILFDITGLTVDLEQPKNLDYGDYATNVALKLTKQLKKAPKLIATEILEKAKALTTDYEFNETNGFINIRIKDGKLFKEMMLITPDYGRVSLGKNQKVLLEYVSANPTGPLHIGHGRWAVVGDTLARVLVYAGYAVTKEFYINDAGNQIANFRKSVEAVKNDQPVPEDGYHGAYVKELATTNLDPVQAMLDQQRETMQRINVVFDTWFSEKTLHASGAVEKAIATLKDHGALYEQEGALWFKSTDYGDDKDRVLIRSNGEKTYFAADIAYHLNKLERGFEKLINMWGADHHGYIPRVQAAIKALTGKPESPLTVILGQLVNLFRNGEPVRMSKRTGEMITLGEVIDEIGADATRYFLVMRSVDTMLDFDLELAKQKSNDNPVYYVQYAHARICSILRQEELQKMSGNPIVTTLEKTERALLLKLIKFPEEIESTATSYGIHRLPTYATELASLFHAFYHECRVITEDKQLTLRRVAIIKSMQIILKTIFDLLAVSAPEKM
jgi:arginyl-tRNA synthetase